MGSDRKVARGTTPRAIAALALVLCLGADLRGTIVGLNQIVTPETQESGVLGVSYQAEHPLIGNSQQIQFELGLTPRFEVAWFEGFQPGEGIFSTEFNVVQSGPHLLSVGVLNWSTRGGEAQPVLEYGFYTGADHLVAGVIQANRRTELLLGYRRTMAKNLQVAVDFQSGPMNSVTAGFTYDLTPTLCVNPAIYRTNGHPHHLLGYVVVTWNLQVWK